eukprot:CAMPEP_0178922454 /NCGR_PEP_ID=MMETSP0786-20121207/16163_1 /TAXON_ID=186022 /ORGANISM="Thalassionema frauenfeldii, Strain CCMP 1798" /LENGTH=709 /DNA_ID=CAMNT_0020596821 /DNA_START=110 /DNA_END=2236 /DNA_ORIENTATION=+
MIKFCIAALILLSNRSDSFVFRALKPRSVGSAAPTSLHGKVWDKIQREEDVEPDWYLLNCVAGMEMDLLEMCRDLSVEMPPEDVIKFIVPTVKQTRSHGKSRMLTETKVKFQGYVFAKLRLCPETYEPIQSLDLCRSWMGTVHRKGHRKLPPVPIPLNEMEVEDYGLEEWEDEEEEEEEEEDGEEDDGIILDTEETDARDEAKWAKENEIDEEQLAEFKGLKVEDMIKVINSKSKFYGEDGIVKRLKAGQIMIRFFTYGSMYDEWLDPSDVRKLSTEELLKGLSGPAAPITQRDFDDGGGASHHPGGRSGLRNYLMSNVRGFKGQRNTRRDRTYRENYKDQKQQDENWEWYKKQQQEGDAQRDFSIGSFENQPDFTRSQKTQRQRRERRSYTVAPKSQDDLDNALDGADDWSAFVSSPKDISKAESDENDFFDSLMSELNAEENQQKTNDDDDDDAFFSSFMSEIENDTPKKKSQSKVKEERRDDDNDFFANLEAELAAGGTTDDANDEDFFSKLESQISSKEDNGSVETKSEDTDDFFSQLEKELESSNKDDDDFFTNLEQALDDKDDFTIGNDVDTTTDDFFANLEKELDGNNEIDGENKVGTDTDDFFSQLENEFAKSDITDGVGNEGNKDGGDDDFLAQIERELSKEPSTLKKQKSNSQPSSLKKKKDLPNLGKEKATPPTIDETSLGQKTVPVLKDMLRERGLK